MLNTPKPQLKDYFQWDVENWSKALALWQRALNSKTKLLKCLELGAREGGLSLWLAAEGNEVVCSDLESPESKAAPIHQRFGLRSQITYAAIDATQIPYENHFDIIILKSILGNVGGHENFERQQMAIASVHKALKTGGMLLYAENLKASKLHVVSRKLFTNWGSYWRYLTANEVESLMKPFAKNEMHTTGLLGSFGRSEKARKLLGKIDGKLFSHKSFHSYHYICYGVAVK